MQVKLFLSYSSSYFSPFSYLSAFFLLFSPSFPTYPAPRALAIWLEVFFFRRNKTRNAVAYI